MKGPFGPLRFGAVLAILLGLVRAAGGVALLATGPGLDPAIRAAPSATAIVGSVLLLLGAALVVAGIGLLGRRPSAWPWTIAGLVAFVIDGAVNGWVLYGRPGDGGTLANAVAATLIATILFAGRGAVRRIDGK